MKSREERKRAKLLKQLRNSPMWSFQIVNQIMPELKGMRRVRVIKHFRRLKHPETCPARPERKTKAKAWHKVNPAGTGKRQQPKPLCSMMLRLFCNEC